MRERWPTRAWCRAVRERYLPAHARERLAHVVGEVDGRAGRPDLPLHELAPGGVDEQRRAGAENHRGEVEHELVHQAGVDALADDLAAAHHEHVLVAGHGLGLLDGSGHVGHEAEVEPEAHVGRRLVVTTKNGGRAACCAP
jgi:hypothetical protein